MFKIVSDVTRYPITEIDLSQETARLNFVPTTSITNTNITFGRPDGGQHIYGRKGRSQFDLEISYGLTESDYKELIRMQETGTIVHLFPNFDKHTRFSAPLSKSTKALQFNPLTKKYVYDYGTYTGTNQDAYALDSDNNFEVITSGTARFYPSAIGNGIYLTNRNTNLVDAPGHATEGALLLSGLTGTGFIQWRDNQYDTSPAPMFSGVGRFWTYGAIPSASRMEVTCTASTNIWFGATIWVKGRGNDTQISFYDSSGTSVSNTTVDLTEEWQRVRLKIYKTSADTTLYLGVALPGVTSTAEYVLYGPVNIQQMATGVGQYEHIPEWEGVGSTDHDQLVYNSYQKGWPDDRMTISVVGKVPTYETSSTIVRVDSATNNRLEWRATLSGLTLTYGGVEKTVEIADWDNLEGEDYWACFRQQRVNTTNTFKGSVYINDTEYTFSETPGGVGLPFITEPSNFYVGGVADSGGRSGDCYPQFLRIDDRYWTDDEVTLHRKMFTDSTFRNLIMMTTGKKFIISSVNLSPQPGKWHLMRGTVTFTEVGQEAGMELGY